MTDAQPGNVFGTQAPDRTPCEVNLTLAAQHAADGTQGAGLASAVGSEKGGDSPLSHVKAQAVQDTGAVICGRQIAHFKQVAHGTLAPR